MRGWRALTAIPSPLVCVVVLTVLASWQGLPLATVADLGQLHPAPTRLGPAASTRTLNTLRVILLPALAIAMVGLLNPVLTAARGR